MAKNIADYIIDLLDKDDSDFKQIFKRTHDWKYVLHNDIRQNIHLGNTKMDLDIKKYVKIMCGKNQSLPHTLLTSKDIPSTICYSSEATQQALFEIANFRRNRDQMPDILWCITDYPTARIIDPNLQTLIDYCRSLDFKIHCATYYSVGFTIHLSWEHWSI